jgi:geranylgeranyl pyrophosphate synthase
VNKAPLPHPVALASSPAERFECIAADLKSLNEVIRERLHSEVTLIQTVAEYIIAAGGKRLRPVILAWLVERCGVMHRLTGTLYF